MIRATLSFQRRDGGRWREIGYHIGRIFQERGALFREPVPNGERNAAKSPAIRELGLPIRTIHGPEMAMDITQRLSASLTTVDAALAALLDGLRPVAVAELPVQEALGCVAAEMASVEPYPQRNIAVLDGWAFRAIDLVGASAYAPVALAASARWVEAGDPIPDGCDCVIDADGVDRSGPISQVVAEVPPGHGVRRRGGDFPDGFKIAPGEPLRPLDILFAHAVKLEKLHVRRPRLRVVNAPATNGEAGTARLIHAVTQGEGAEVTFATAKARDAASIAAELETTTCDLLITIGGSGVGRTDATVVAISQRGEVIAHGLALKPGTTSAIGRIGKTPVIALSGAAVGAMAAWWTLGLPVLDRLSGRQPREAMILPLARKLASSVGITEIALLGRDGGNWQPLALGDLPLQALLQASAWLAIPGNSEGFAAGTPIGAYMLR